MCARAGLCATALGPVQVPVASPTVWPPVENALWMRLHIDTAFPPTEHAAHQWQRTFASQLADAVGCDTTSLSTGAVPWLPLPSTDDHAAAAAHPPLDVGRRLPTPFPSRPRLAVLGLERGSIVVNILVLPPPANNTADGASATDVTRALQTQLLNATSPLRNSSLLGNAPATLAVQGPVPLLQCSTGQWAPLCAFYACQINVCNNGGSCALDANDVVHCDCPAGFMGKSAL